MIVIKQYPTSHKFCSTSPLSQFFKPVQKLIRNHIQTYFNRVLSYTVIILKWNKFQLKINILRFSKLDTFLSISRQFYMVKITALYFLFINHNLLMIGWRIWLIIVLNGTCLAHLMLLGTLLQELHSLSANSLLNIIKVLMYWINLYRSFEFLHLK